MKNIKTLIGIIAAIAIIGTILTGCASMTIVSIDSIEGPKQIAQYKDIDTKDITVNATYKDGSQKRATNVSIAAFDNTRVGPQTVGINIGFKTASIDVEVLALKSLTGPGPSENRLVRQFYGIEVSDVKLYGVWDKIGNIEIPFSVKPIRQQAGGAPMNPDGPKNSISGVDNVTGFDADEIGAQTITVEYKGLETSFGVTVIPMSGIKILSLPVLEYKVGQDLNLIYFLGMEVEGSWEGLPNKRLPISVDYIHGYNKNKPGKQTLSYSIYGKSATFDVNVSE